MITADSILHDLEAYVFAVVCQTHPEKTALACAGALFECLFLNFRKQCLYVPTSDKNALLDKYQSVWRDFRGHNHNELSIKYRLSVQQIYTIIKIMRRDSIRQVQSDLFPLPETETDKPIVLAVLEDYLPHELQRAGLSIEQSIELARKIADYLCASYPGISIRITESMRNRRQRGSHDLFDEAI